jgi:catalase
LGSYNGLVSLGGQFVMIKNSYEDNIFDTETDVPANNDESSLTVGEDGPVLLQDIQLLEKLAHFNRERIPERVVHAKGVGIHGYFRVYMPMSDYTKAAFFQNPELKTPVFVRFSTFIGSKGSADTARDPRGFAVKFYTEEGNYDLVGSSLPVFFIRDGMKFPDLIHALRPAPNTNLSEPDRFWEFISRTPEATHMIIWLFSDRGTIKSYRTMEGFGVNTYVWICPKGNRYFARCHWKPMAGVKTISRQEAEFLAGYDPDAATRDLYDSIENGEVTEYELWVQLIPEKNKDQFDFDILDATKIWPDKLVPPMRVGKMTLNKAPDDYLEEVEKSAFNPANIVPGIDFSFDKLLQGRLFSYRDAQMHRLGANFSQIKINSARNLSKDPLKVELEKNVQSTTIPIIGNIKRKTSGIDDFSQAGESYRSFSKEEQDCLVENLIDSLMFVDEKIQDKIIGFFIKADEEFGNRVKKGLDYF